MKSPLFLLLLVILCVACGTEEQAPKQKAKKEAQARVKPAAKSNPIDLIRQMPPPGSQTLQPGESPLTQETPDLSGSYPEVDSMIDDIIPELNDEAVQFLKVLWGERSTCEEGKREFVPEGDDRVTVNVSFNCKAKQAMGTPDGDRLVVRTRKFHTEDGEWVMEEKGQSTQVQPEQSAEEQPEPEDQPDQPSEDEPQQDR